ncbi:HAMP domain-containing protein [Agrobacterium vitis]|uniref:histidine kinase n=2 Tax=Agrobacterium vitis TaxID=373 RepID=A0A368P013_AGRVI|nr:ATP-binding protein [Agrobacterium vitis]KAA3507447.1 HAMP domain-containing protein [Agrobacterium vitis]KAA3521111.1 HAMP domain-containing protein [Agrobacterium vitis]MCF1480064.1 HAMP domain-containing protein [Agrobacterium vitis]MUZ96823.1 HAMP domain-containing protein [Agrobacterium vitis]MVA31837.1 HAMP domain-containing protein [Agrobacterium vitis]
MSRNFRVLPRTLRGQITVIILLALVTVIATGRTLENVAKNDYAIPNLESTATQVRTLALLLAQASPDERTSILTNAQRAGLEVSLQPISLADKFKTSPEFQGFAETFVDFLFPPDGEPPLGGWRAFLDGRRVFAEKVDDRTMLVFFGLPDTILTTSFLSQTTYYFIAVVVLIAFFFAFAIRAVTEPIKRISEAAIKSDINNSSQIFEERGTVEILSLARALNGMRNRIRIMVDGRTRMLRGISHDVRTPLTRLRLRSERMEAGALREALLADIDHIDDLLTESLNYLRDDFATEGIERVDVVSILQTVCSDFSDIGFDVEYQGPNKLIANCRPLSIMRAVTNLCDNATKFGKTVLVKLQVSGTVFSILVIDDGPGIPKDLREKVFEPFFKGDASRSKRAGFGLGLSIVADIAHAHQSKITLLSNHPTGLIVRIDIPCPGSVP